MIYKLTDLLNDDWLSGEATFVYLVYTKLYLRIFWIRIQNLADFFEGINNNDEYVTPLSTISQL
jgi:hypothetical protein